MTNASERIGHPLTRESLDFVLLRMNVVNLTQRELAAKAGIHESHISKILSGHRGVSMDLLHRLADALQTSAGSILNGRSAPEDDYRPSLADEAFAMLVRGWPELPESERQFISEFVENRRKLRERSEPVAQPEEADC